MIIEKLEEIREKLKKLKTKKIIVHLVDHSRAKSALKRHPVDDHGVLHVVAGVGDNSNDGIRPHWVVVHAFE